MKRVDLCLRILSPIHIGTGKRDSSTYVAQTRPYVPGKTLWGAATSRVTRVLHDKPRGNDYAEVGSTLKESIKVSYLFPADIDEDHTTIYIDEYAIRNGRVTVSDQVLLGSMTSTSVCDGGAVDGTLHELRFIKHMLGQDGVSLRPLYLVGRVFLDESQETVSIHSNTLMYNDIPIFEGIRLGGERNYGFGRTECVSLVNADFMRGIFPDNPESFSGLPIDEEGKVLLPGHCQADPEHLTWTSGLPEMLLERETNPNTGQSVLVSRGLHVPPGGVLSNTSVRNWRMDGLGRFTLVNDI